MKAERVKEILLIGHSFVYLVAFISLYWQIPGLYGEKGLLPIASKLNCNTAYCESKRVSWTILPSVINYFRIAPSYALQILMLFGIILSSLSIIFAKFRNTLSYLAFFTIYSSAFHVGDVFLWYQWDTLLLESGVLCILLSDLPFIGSSPADNISIFLIRWLVFRLMYASGIVKLTSECPFWWDLAALDIHFESQCIPTWLAYFAHHTSKYLRHLAVAITFFIEIIQPPMFLMPFYSLRLFSFYPQLFLMFSIILTGNYNFFNLIYALQCVSIVVDSSEYKFSTKTFGEFISLNLSKFGNFISNLIIIASLIAFVKYFGVSLKDHHIGSRIMFSKGEFSVFVEESVYYLMIFGICMFALEIISAVIRLFTESSRGILAFLHTFYVIFFGCLLFSISLVPFAILSRSAKTLIPERVVNLHDFLDPYQLTHSYGLFRRMTGEFGRPEVIIEGAHDIEGPWIPFNFYAKPGNLSATPRFIIPHQPRLDWQMWFAALGAYQYNPFFISLTHHLFVNNSEVTYLMDKYPFEEKLPKFIRAHLYLYRYTEPNFDKEMWPTKYWRRNFQEEYMPPITKDDPGVLNYLHKNGYLLKHPFSIENENFALQNILTKLHNYIRQYDPAILIQSTILTYIVLFVLHKFIQ